MSNYAAKARADLVQHIRQAPTFLDAVFLTYHSRWKVWGGLPEISPCEVFETYDAALYADCLNRSMALLAMSPRIGEAAYSYPGAIPYEQALDQMKEEHPGFSEECYAAVVSKGWLEMR